MDLLFSYPQQLTISQLKSLRVLSIRETFQDIYRAKDTEEFKMLLSKWYYWATHSRLDPIKKHWDGIIRWKESQINNGILEGLNSIVQASKAKARGFSILKNYKIMAYLVTADLDFSVLNKYYLPTA